MSHSSIHFCFTVLLPFRQVFQSSSFTNAQLSQPIRRGDAGDNAKRVISLLLFCRKETIDIKVSLYNYCEEIRERGYVY